MSGVKNQTEAWDHAGPRRNPQFDDGSQADEELTEIHAGSSFAYQLTNFTNILSRLAAGVASSTSTPTATAPSSAGPTSQAAARPTLDPRRPLRPALAPLRHRPRPVRPRRWNGEEQRAGAARLPTA